MLNDRFNSGSKNDLKSKLRDKRVISAIAIGVFVLILLIVLMAKGCSKPKPQPKKGADIKQKGNPGGNNDITPPNKDQGDDLEEDETTPKTKPAVRKESRTDAQIDNEKNVKTLLRWGKRFANGDKFEKDLKKALKCFQRAKKLSKDPKDTKTAAGWIKQVELDLKKAK